MTKINISEFNRPGVFTRETDASQRPVVIDSSRYFLVPGFSRKGPINRPVLISSPQEFVNVFGPIDRALEKKGCFFHRTIINLLGTAPVWALNLLDASDELDKLDWASLSTSSNTPNSIVKSAPLSRFYDKSDFWYLDTESFVDLARESADGEVLHITNLSSRKASVFIFKSTNTVYAQTLELWYGGKSKVPAYLNSSDLVSDYLINMLIVEGDFSDYNNLSVDSRWSKYFTKSGLKKDMLQAFASDSATTALRYYSDLSLIPYFKDANRKDMFIESVVNNDTQTTGIFVAYDIAAVEDLDYSTGLLDLIGNNLVSDDKETINYLSYKENISETITFKKAALNRAGNALGGTTMMMEGRISAAIGGIEFEKITGTGATELVLDTTSINSYILNGVLRSPSVLNKNVIIPNIATVNYVRKDTIYLDSNGSLGIVKGVEIKSSSVTNWDGVPLKALSASVLPIAYVTVGSFPLPVGNAVAVTPPTSTATVTGTGNIDITGLQTVVAIPSLTVGTSSSGTNIALTYTGKNQLTVTFNNTRLIDSDTLYTKSRLNSLFNQVQSKLKMGVSVIKDLAGNKVVIDDLQLVTEATENKALIIRVKPGIDIDKGISPEIYFIDDELVFTSGISTTSGVKSSATTGYGKLSENSALYQAYVKGNINSGDYFFPAFFDHKFGKVEFVVDGATDKISLFYNDGDIDPSKLGGKSIKIAGSVSNNSVFRITNQEVFPLTTGAYNKRLDLIVNENVTAEVTINPVSVLDALSPIYMRMYFMNKDLSVEFTGSDLIGQTAVNTAVNYNLDEIQVLSKRNNFKQNVEIEQIVETNKILVSATAYSSLKVGDYLKAYVDVNQLENGEVAKRLTRIVAKRLSSSTLIELTTDSQIDISYFGASRDAQTFRYTSMEEYVNTYTAFVLRGFKVREDSAPNGSETRQDEILSLIARGTAIFKGLCNRNKIQWRYLVDAWGLGLNSNSKHQLVDLCGERLTAFGILNMPSAKDFKNCSATSFVNKKTKALEIEYIKHGGDPATNPSFLYGFGEGKGQSNVGYFFPNVTINDNGRSVIVPPAAYVANTFMNKHSSRLASVKPWSVAAGLNTGALAGFVNVEMDLTGDDIGYLHAMNANPIVYKMGRGFCIETDNTAQVSPKSALSYIHVREMLVELEEELYNMLLNYQSAFNTKEVREEIKTQADQICERYVRENAMYNFENFMDDDPENIDLGVAILNTHVEPVKAMGIIINDITIQRTGDIKSGGFRSA